MCSVMCYIFIQDMKNLAIDFAANKRLLCIGDGCACVAAISLRVCIICFFTHAHPSTLYLKRKSAFFYQKAPAGILHELCIQLSVSVKSVSERFEFDNEWCSQPGIYEMCTSCMYCSSSASGRYWQPNAMLRTHIHTH